jgi:hypothetical protein
MGGLVNDQFAGPILDIRIPPNLVTARFIYSDPNRSKLLRMFGVFEEGTAENPGENVGLDGDDPGLSPSGGSVTGELPGSVNAVDIELQTAKDAAPKSLSNEATLIDIARAAATAAWVSYADQIEGFTVADGSVSARPGANLTSVTYFTTPLGQMTTGMTFENRPRMYNPEAFFSDSTKLALGLVLPNRR